ncbi:MAG: hypothetical protein Q4D99_08385, partial [Bacillota bacterium]|nr:hypothetical protein [Bacillota bacterium]
MPKARKQVCVRLEELGISDIKPVSRNSLEYREILASAGEIITDDALPAYFIKKQGQKLTMLCQDIAGRKYGRSNLIEASDLGLIQKTMLEADCLEFENDTDEAATKREFMIACLTAEGGVNQPKIFYAGDLTRPENCHLVECVLKKEAAGQNEIEAAVVLFEEDIKPAVAEFIQKFDESIEFIQITADGSVTFLDYVWQNLYRNHGWFSKKAEKLYEREYRRNFSSIDSGDIQSINFLNTGLYERIEELLLCKSRKIFHRVPPLYYRQLVDVFMAKPEKLEKMAGSFDEAISYDMEFGSEIWDSTPATGIYIKPSGIRVSSDSDSICLKMKLKINGLKSEEKIEPDGTFLIGSTLHERTFEYPMKMSGDGSISVQFPKEDINGWYTNNLPMIGFKVPWGKLRVPILTAAKSGEKAYSTGTGNAFVVRQNYRHLRIIIREDMITDRPLEKLKLGAAFALHLITPWHKPVILYEKYC